MDVAGVLQEAGDADSRTHTGSQVPVEYTIIPYTSMIIRLPHICQGYHDHCVVTTYDGGWEAWELLHLCYGLGGGHRGGYRSFYIFCSVFVLL